MLHGEKNYANSLKQYVTQFYLIIILLVRGAFVNDPLKNQVILKTDLLDYIEARHAIYIPLYLQAVQYVPKAHELKARLLQGENLPIIEVDGHPKNLLNIINNCITNMIHLFKSILCSQIQIISILCSMIQCIMLTMDKC